VPLATPSAFSVLAVLCHRIWESGRSGLEEEIEEIRALRKARATLDRLAIFRSRPRSTNCSIKVGTFMGRENAVIGHKIGTQPCVTVPFNSGCNLGRSSRIRTRCSLPLETPSSRQHNHQLHNHLDVSSRYPRSCNLIPETQVNLSYGFWIR
jgi:hypothetical protein